MASIGIHNIKDSNVKIKHFDNFSVINLELKTQSEYKEESVYEKMDFYFDTPEQLQSFVSAISSLNDDGFYNSLTGA
jgi:hypothetical protein